MIDKLILKQLRGMLRDTRKIKPKTNYVKGIIRGIDESVKLTEAIMKQAGKKID